MSTIRKYNATYHSGIVDNVRRLAKDNNLSTIHRTDEEVFALFNDCYFCDEPEKEMIATLQTEQKTGVKPHEVIPDPEIVELLSYYDNHAQTMRDYFIGLVEHIQKGQRDRATVIASVMKARACTFETAQVWYARLKFIFNNEETLDHIRKGYVVLQWTKVRTRK